jgi:glycosyltransferase involved in cell wall biosynthesis
MKPSSSTKPALSVIICTHNPRKDYLQSTLDSLKAQSLRPSEWELVIIDNASTKRVSDDWSIGWHPRGRHVREDRLGLTQARLRGIAETTESILVFIDDDNVLNQDYLNNVQIIAADNDSLGAFGAGELVPRFEVDPPRSILPRISMLALRSVVNANVSYDAKTTSCIPWGAGLCVRRTVAETYMRIVQMIRTTETLGRRGTALFCGEDDLFSFVATQMKLGFGIFPELKITHLIGAPRLTEQYFLRLIKDHAFSHGILRFLLYKEVPLFDRRHSFARCCLHGLRHGRFAFRCRRAEASGIEAASALIAQERLAPLSFLSSTRG